MHLFDNKTKLEIDLSQLPSLCVLPCNFIDISTVLFVIYAFSVANIKKSI